MLSTQVVVDSEQAHALTETSATVPAAKQAASPVGLPMSAAAAPLVFDSDVDNNKSWFQTRSG